MEQNSKHFSRQNSSEVVIRLLHFGCLVKLQQIMDEVILKLFSMVFVTTLIGFGLIVNTSFAQNSTPESNYSEPSAVFGKTNPLVGISDVAELDNQLFVLTTSYPAIHVFDKANKDYISWGKEGNGPGELKGPKSIEIYDEHIFVLDFQPGKCKIVKYDRRGNHISTVPVRGYFCYDMKFGGNNKFIEVGQFMSSKRTILSVGDSLTPVKSYKLLNKKKIKTPEGPMNNITVANPFLPAPRWNVLPDGNLVYWDGKSGELSILSPAGKKISKITIPETKEIALTSKDIDNWIQTKYAPTPLFGHKDFYKGVRSSIKDQMSYPDSYPRLLDIKTSNSNEIWLKKSDYKTTGDVWIQFNFSEHKLRQNNRFVLPSDTTLEAVTKDEIITKVMDKDGPQYIQLYNSNNKKTEGP